MNVILKFYKQKSSVWPNFTFGLKLNDYLTVHQCVEAHKWKNTDVIVSVTEVPRSSTRGREEGRAGSESQACRQECETDMQPQ